MTRVRRGLALATFCASLMSCVIVGAQTAAAHPHPGNRLATRSVLNGQYGPTYRLNTGPGGKLPLLINVIHGKVTAAQMMIPVDPRDTAYWETIPCAAPIGEIPIVGIGTAAYRLHPPVPVVVGRAFVIHEQYSVPASALRSAYSGTLDVTGKFVTRRTARVHATYSVTSLAYISDPGTCTGGANIDLVKPPVLGYPKRSTKR